MDQNWGDNWHTGRVDKPSWDLLEMQWNLQRVAALCGVADVTDDYYDYEDPDERGYDEAVAAKQRTILAKYEEGWDKGKVVNQEKGK
ncbi:hypothetical protein B0T25DRAFT_568511 [Lasiosphaeria hispida]|uniref:Uncharacterized protein n=1 Tax=Lasiosphaeria hispida TaxID=260671 RepID=A0AAJ0MEC0_9PEZI|nr:hypothetical protein B0T25DRAFT_568511 [Lasiosphaeria hispida]